MVKKSKFVVVFLSACLLFSLFVSSASANEIEKIKDNTQVISKDNAIYDSELGKYVTPLKKVDGKLVPVSIEEYEVETKDVKAIDETEKLYNEFNTDSDIRIMADYREYWIFERFETMPTYVGSTIKVTADIGCTTPICRIDKNVSVTVSASYNVSAPLEISAIKANAGFTWTNSASDSSVYSFSLVKGDRGYIGFKPYYKRVRGTLKKYSNWDGYLGISKTGIGYSVKKTASGEADGYYYFVHY